jgi:3-methyladenine DNA glycosylase AlkC
VIIAGNSNEDWRRLTESLADLICKFLHSMRKLQKVVHKKETNVQKEKQDFELSKKELEFYLKQIKTSLEDNPAVRVSNEMDHSGKLDHIKPLQPQSMRVGHINNELA